MTDDDRRKLILIELVKAGITDLDSLANQVAKTIPADWDPESEITLFIGEWFVAMPQEQ